MATDLFGHSVIRKDGVWQATTSIEPPTESSRVGAVSCTSASFCAVLDIQGDAFTYDGTSWTRWPGAGISINAAVAGSTSCVSATFCVAVVGTEASIFDGAGWSAPKTIVSGAGSLTSVSCVSVSFCMAIDTAGNVARYDGVGWTSLSGVLSASYSSASVSCSSTVFCVAVTLGSAATFNGTGWSSATTVTGAGTSLVSVSCPSEMLCVAVEAHGYAVELTGGSWSAPVSIDPTDSMVAVACPTTSECVAIDAHGQAMSRTQTGWSPPSTFLHSTGWLTSVSCPTASFCAAVDREGNALTRSASGWSAPHNVVIDARFSTVTCSSATWCVAIGSRPSRTSTASLGVIASYNGTAWTANTDAPFLQTVSCAPDGSCVGLGYSGDFVTYRNGAWSTPAASGFSDLGGNVSCVSHTFCMTSVARYNGTTWVSVSTLANPSPSGQTISCASISSCAVPLDNGISTFDGHVWQLSTTLDAWQRGAPISCVTSTFCMVVSYGDAMPFEKGLPGQPTLVADWPNATVWNVGTGLGSVSCPSTEACVAVDSTSAVSWHTHVAPVIVTQPKDGSAAPGGSVSLAVTVTGNPAPLMVWQRRDVALDRWVNASTVSAPDQPWAASVSGDYRGVISNSAGQATTVVAHVTIGSPPVIVLQPRSAVAVRGRAVAFAASVTSSTATTVRWQRSTDGGRSWSLVPGVTSTRLTVVSVVDARYRALFTNADGTTATAAAVLTVWFAPRITVQPVSRSAYAGRHVTFVAWATAAPTASVVWQRSLDRGHHWSNLRGANSMTLTLTAARALRGSEYRAVFTNRAGRATTRVAVLSVR